MSILVDNTFILPSEQAVTVAVKQAQPAVHGTGAEAAREGVLRVTEHGGREAAGEVFKSVDHFFFSIILGNIVWMINV